MSSPPRFGLARILALVGLMLLLATVVGSWALDRGWLELPITELASRYQLPDSQFIDVDGVRVHYVDRGSGPPVVLLHASFLSLRSWDALSAQLEGRFRVIRLDLSGAGLTGDDPTGRYGIERNIELVRGLLAHLSLSSVAVVGTSSGGIAAFRYAASYPDEVSRLLLINSAGMPRTAATNPNLVHRPAFRLAAWVQARYRSRKFWAESLAGNFVPPHQPSADLIDMTYDMNRRAGIRAINALYLANFSTGDPQQVLGTVRAPTLVLWGLENRTVMHLEADVFAHWLSAAPLEVRKYPGLGHYAYIEEPAVVARDVADFLAGNLDSELSFPCPAE